MLEDDACACLLVEGIAKKLQNIKWSTKVDGKNVQHYMEKIETECLREFTNM
ncbi:Eco47II family restriction endonuclease [Velocimicrobium porci]|uniref:Eco47II family restriction endonuclease n=1 Tax=Velocimicrobium porci TaxID=2606634 RepID=UPI0038CD9DA7